jgi:hypothetical protein
MKKVCFLLLSLIAFSCSPKLSERLVTTMFFDYGKAAESGVFLSPDFYHDKFTPVGDLTIFIAPAMEKLFDKPYYDYQSEQYAKYALSSIYEEEISSSELIKIISGEVKKRGGDGFVNFKINVESHYDSNINRIVTRYLLSGFIIKRAEK